MFEVDTKYSCTELPLDVTSAITFHVISSFRPVPVTVSTNCCGSAIRRTAKSPLDDTAVAVPATAVVMT